MANSNLAPGGNLGGCPRTQSHHGTPPCLSRRSPAGAKTDAGWIHANACIPTTPIPANQPPKIFFVPYALALRALQTNRNFFLKKMHFLLCISPFGCLMGYRQAHDPHRHSSCFSPPSRRRMQLRRGKPRLPVQHPGPPSQQGGDGERRRHHQPPLPLPGLSAERCKCKKN